MDEEAGFDGSCNEIDRRRTLRQRNLADRVAIVEIRRESGHETHPHAGADQGRHRGHVADLLAAQGMRADLQQVPVDDPAGPRWSPAAPTVRYRAGAPSLPPRDLQAWRDQPAGTGQPQRHAEDVLALEPRGAAHIGCHNASSLPVSTMSCSTSSSASTTSHERPVHCWNSRITAGSTVLAIKGDTRRGSRLAGGGSARTAPACPC